MANTSIAPNLIEVGLMGISTMLIEMLLSKEIDFKKNVCTAIGCFNVSTFYIPWLYKNSYVKKFLWRRDANFTVKLGGVAKEALLSVYF